MSSEILTAIFGAILGGGFTIWTTRSTLNDSLDSKSEWRKQLYDASSKTFIDLNDVYRLKSSVRYNSKIELFKEKEARDFKTTLGDLIPKDSIAEYDSFDFMTAFTLYYCDYLINKGLIDDTESDDTKSDDSNKYHSITINVENTIIIRNFQEAECFRILVRYFLKRQWEVLSNGGKLNWIISSNYWSKEKEKELSIETLELFKEVFNSKN